MKCKTCQKNLHLYRRGELSPRQKEKIEQHTAVCSRCAKIKRKADRMEEYVGYLRQEEPRMKEPDVLTGSIMQYVNFLKKQGQKSVIGAAAFSFWDYVIMPKIRMALTSIVFLFIGSFFVQEFLVLNRLSRLEKKIAEQSPPLGWLGTALFKNTQRIMQTTDPDLIKNLLAADTDETGTGEWILIHRITLHSLLTSNTQLQETQQRLLDTLTTLLPDLKIISLEDGLTNSERRVLRQNKTRILQTLHKL